MDPEEIQNREFLVSLRGYDREEVDAFAREVAEEIKKLRAQLATGEPSPPPASAIPEPVAAPTAAADRSDALKQIGEETSKILLAAEQVGEDIKEKARREAAGLLADARDEAERIKKESSDRRREAEEDLRQLTEARSVLATQLEDVRRRLDETISRLVSPLSPPKASVKQAPPILKPVPDAKPEVAAPKEPTAKPKAEPSSPPKTETSPPKKQVVKEEAPKEIAPKKEPPKEELQAVIKLPSGGPAVGEEAEEKKAPTLSDVLHEVRKEREEGRKEVEAALAEVSTPPKTSEKTEPSRQPLPSDPLLARNELLGEAPDTAARRMKRLLQEDQNDLLDRLRTQRGKGSVDENIPAEGEQVARFKEGLSEILGSAFKQGREVAGGDGAGDVDNAVVGLITKQLVLPLRTEVSRTVAAGLEAQDTATAIAERVSDVFRVWKGVRTEMLGEGLVHAAFHQGQIDAWRGQSSTQKKWVLDQERDCPKDVCKNNSEAGFLAVDSAFPSGHMAPPAHGGCTCTLTGSNNTA